MLCKFYVLFEGNILTSQMTESEKERDNQWDQVDDFKWLKASESPNWRTMAEEERLADDVWTKIVPGRPGASCEETLAEVGLPGQ